MFEAVRLEVILLFAVMTNLTKCWIQFSLSGLRLSAAVFVTVAIVAIVGCSVAEVTVA